jgi:flagellar biosynthesis protein FlhG
MPSASPPPPEQVVVVVTPDPTSLADAYATIKVLSQRDVQRFNLVVNMASSTREAEQVTARLLGLVERFLDVLVVPVGFVYRDEAVLKSVRSCRPLVRVYPHATAASSIRAIATRLISEPLELRAGGPLLFWKRLMGLEATSGARREGSDR